MYEEILDVAKFFSNKMLKSLEGITILIIITDENGYLLDILGDKTIRETMFKLHLKNVDIVLLTKLITESVKVYADQKKIRLDF